jgi:hypothetical protein
MSEPIQCNLVQNALDYLILAGEQAQEGSPRMLKHSLATLADGIELLLKAQVEIYDWCLLFKNVDEADEKKYASGDFQSVSVDQSINRLKNICGIEIEQSSISVLETLRKQRNKIRHFTISTNQEEVKSLITKTYSFALDFTTKYLEAKYDGGIDAELNELRRMLGEFGVFVESRLKEIQKILENQDYAWHIECPKCTQETLYPSEGHAKCAFCGYDKDGEEAAEDWCEYHSPWKGPKERMIDEDVDACPECGKWSCAYIEEKETWICFSCGESGDYRYCNICGRLFSGEPNPGNRCDDCWNELLSKD